MYSSRGSFLAAFCFLQQALCQDESIATITSTLPPVTGTVTVTGTNPTGTPSTQYTDELDLRTSVLNSTNFFRYEHSAQFLAWNESLASYAADWASQCNWQHSHGPPGENLARGYPDVTGSVDAWGNERDLYDFDTPTGFTEETGHFTALVWRGTQSVGCAAENCNGRNGLDGYYLVCEYWPPGNIEWTGEGDRNRLFRDNVLPERSGGSQGFNELSATIGATGVTGWATGSLVPTATSDPSGNEAGMIVRDATTNWILVAGMALAGLNWF